MKLSLLMKDCNKFCPSNKGDSIQRAYRLFQPVDLCLYCSTLPLFKSNVSEPPFKSYRHNKKFSLPLTGKLYHFKTNCPVGHVSNPRMLLFFGTCDCCAPE